MKSNHLFILLALIFTSLAAAAQDKGLRVLSYNVLEGFKNDSTLKTKFVNWVKPKSPDIIFYQEMNKFTQKSLEELAIRYGHPYAVLSKTAGYPVAISSKYPIVNTQIVLESMHHGYIYANIRGIHVFNIHFSPHNALKRRQEVDQIVAHASLLPKKSKIIIAGDFNSYSAKDSELYNAAQLEEAKALEARLVHVRNLVDGQFDFYIPAALERFGLIDSSAKQNAGKERSYRRRIDYVFVSKNLAKGLVSSDFIRDDVTRTLSDHLPVWVEFNF